jgi:MFS family permease
VIASYRHVLQSRTYFPIWAGQLVSNLGDTVTYVALVVLIFQMTRSGLALSGLVLFQVVPVLVVGPVAGPIIDRFPRKTILIAADTVRAGFAIGLIFANTAWQVYVLAFCMSVATLLRWAPPQTRRLASPREAHAGRFSSGSPSSALLSMARGRD